MPNTGTVQLRSGRTILLRSLRQWDVYAGLLEGLPTVERNQEIIEQLLQKERDRPPPSEPYLIPPTQRPIEHDGPYPFGKPSTLPEIACVAFFESTQPAQDQTQDFSVLTVIWFQDEFAFPIDAEVLEKIRAIDWETHALDFEY